jgi:hypothetical protein
MKIRSAILEFLHVHRQMDKATLLGARKRRERTQNGIKKEIYHIPLQSSINLNLNYYSNITCRLRLRNEF